MNTEAKQSIAVVGAGVAGIVSAYLLQRKHDVTLFEADSYLGGHTRTITIEDGPDAGTCVDMGFIVFNDLTYPNFIEFLRQLGVQKQKSNMSFSYFDRRTGFQYSSRNILADRKNILNPRFWWLIKEILRFNQKTQKLLDSQELNQLTLGQYLNKYGFGKDFIEKYIIPMGAAIWSTPDVKMLEFPAQTFARFFSNHGLLKVKMHPQWYTVTGGSHAYVKAFKAQFPGRIHTSCPVRSIVRENGRVRLQYEGGEETFDAVVIGAHADEALNMLADPTPDEKELLGPWQYSENRVLLHTDPAFLPPIERARASWNYIREAPAESEKPLFMTYYMNTLQNLNTRQDYLVTLNPLREVSAEQVINDKICTHPMYTFDAIHTQDQLDRLNGPKNTYFCGSYFRYGFHEDAVLSAVNVGKKFGITL